MTILIQSAEPHSSEIASQDCPQRYGKAAHAANTSLGNTNRLKLVAVSPTDGDIEECWRGGHAAATGVTGTSGWGVEVVHEERGEDENFASVGMRSHVVQRTRLLVCRFIRCSTHTSVGVPFHLLSNSHVC